MNSVTEGILLAIAILLGEVNRHWIHCLVDPVEWSDSHYYHQN